MAGGGEMGTVGKSRGGSLCLADRVNVTIVQQDGETTHPLSLLQRVNWFYLQACPRGYDPYYQWRGATGSHWGWVCSCVQSPFRSGGGSHSRRRRGDTSLWSPSLFPLLATRGGACHFGPTPLVPVRCTAEAVCVPFPCLF